MARSKNIFTRVEKKYIITDKQLDAVTPVILEHMHPDEFGLSTISSTYYDTPDMRLIRASINATTYKEKLRLRCYGSEVTPESTAFIELKKKFKGIVYKRRIEMSYGEALRFLRGETPCPNDQIAREIDYAFRIYPDLRPRMDIFSERVALVDNEDENLRLTVDRDLRYRAGRLEFTNGTDGTPLLPRDRFIVEVKTAFSMPLWLVHLFDEHKVYPGKFSKYATAYNMELDNRSTIDPLK